VFDAGEAIRLSYPDAGVKAIASDMLAQAALFVDYWMPGATDTTRVPSTKSMLPALV
jgi:hypothetical protein